MPYRTIKTPVIDGTITIDEVEKMVRVLTRMRRVNNIRAYTYHKNNSFATFKRSPGSISKDAYIEKKKTIYHARQKCEIDVSK